MSNEYLDFETPIRTIREKIDDLKRLAQENALDIWLEVKSLEEKAAGLEREQYYQMKAWQKIQIARYAQRPTTLDYIHQIFTDFVELHGDRNYGDDPAIVGGIAKLDGRSVTVIGHERGKEVKDKVKRNFGLSHPEGYRKALRLMCQAEKFGRPIITFIDTQGAYPGKEAEERGQGEAIARNLREMIGLRVPVICVVIGEGGSGGALAIGVGNRILMLEHAYYSVISPEGAAAILWKDANQAPAAAEALKLTAYDLLNCGIIDEMIVEPVGGAHRDPRQTAQNIKTSVNKQLAELAQKSPQQLIEQRYQKYEQIGVYGLANVVGD